MHVEDIEMPDPLVGLEQLIFVRHGDRRVAKGKETDQLSPLGFAQSRAAGLWLRERGLIPDIVKAVGHGTAGMKENNNGAVIVCRRGESRWELEDWFPGGET